MQTPGEYGDCRKCTLSRISNRCYKAVRTTCQGNAKGKRRKINNDFTKLYHCASLTETEQNLIRDMTLLSKKFSGAQQIRLMIGHALFGPRVEYGEPWFFTISPSVRHSGLCVRLSRFRLSDPLLGPNSRNAESIKPWHQKDMPNLWRKTDENDVVLDLPSYDWRKNITTTDPWAVCQAFKVSTRFILPRLFGMRMCPRCPHCNETSTPCQNKFGNNYWPWGGSGGLCAAFGAATEYQHCTNPHLHGNANFVSVYQHKTLQEISTMIEQQLLDPECIYEYQAWLHREEHFFEEEHNAMVPEMEKAWKENFKDISHDSLCQLPPFLRDDHVATLWDGGSNMTCEDALEEAKQYSDTYKKETQFVLSRCQHHVHLPDKHTGIRVPLSGCRSKKDKHKCKGSFPMSRRLATKATVICKGNARRYGLRPSGRRML